MIRLERPPPTAPKMLLTKGKILTDRDRAAFDAHPAEFLSGEWPFPPADGKVYGAVGVKRALAKMHNCKCCYCEQKVRLDVEHFRPYGAVQQSVRQKFEKPGYFWLGYCWDNLLLACRRCNRYNKRNLFPLQNPKKRACPPDYKVEDEKPLFIDPASQDPRRHIRFKGATPVDRTKKGRVTICGLGLTKADLREERDKLILSIDAQVVALKEDLEYPGDEELQKKAAEAREFLDQAVKPRSQFSSMAIDYISGFEI